MTGYELGKLVKAARLLEQMKLHPELTGAIGGGLLGGLGGAGFAALTGKSKLRGALAGAGIGALGGGWAGAHYDNKKLEKGYELAKIRGDAYRDNLVVAEKSILQIARDMMRELDANSHEYPKLYDFFKKLLRENKGYQRAIDSSHFNHRPNYMYPPDLTLDEVRILLK